MIPQIYLDLDGVIADIATGYERAFGVRPSTVHDDIDWDKIRAQPHFYQHLPLMPDALELWDFVSGLKRKPIILTGVPKSVPQAGMDKRLMVRRNLGDALVITCASRDKASFAKRGDILIDDWIKYRGLWLAAGGRWITHTSAEASIQQLLEMGIGL